MPKVHESDVIPEYPIRAIRTGAKVFSGFAFKSQYLDDDENGIPVVKIANIHDRQVTLDGSQFLPTDLIDARLDRFFLNDGDVLIAMTGQGSVGRVGQVRLDGKKALLNQRVGKFVVDGRSLDRDYLYFVISSPRYETILFDTGSGSGQPNLSPDQILSVRIPMPEVEIQKKISSFLRSVNDKTHLNNQTNRTFEAIGKTIFKHWFIDFEFPNKEGNPYKSSGGEMVWNEGLGKETPKDWKMGKLGDISKITMGQSPPGDTYNETGNGIPFYQGIRDFGFRFPRKRVFCDSPTRLAENGDVLLSVRAPIGSLNVASEKCCIGRGVASIRHDKNYQSFLYYLLTSTRENWNSYEAEGTVFGAVTKPDVNEFAIILPSDSAQASFESIILPIDTRIRLNEEESSNLSRLQDALLPRLISGAVSIPVEV